MTQVSENEFLNRLLKVVRKLSNIANTQSYRFKKIWNEYLKPINDKPHTVRKISLDNNEFLNDIDYRINVLKKIEQSQVDGFYSIKSLLETLYKSYFNDSKLFKRDFSEEDQLILKYIVAKEILGNLIQYNKMEHETVPLKYNIISRNYLLIKLQGLKDSEIIENMKKLNINIDPENLNKIMDEIELDGIISKSKKDKSYFYKINKELELSKEGLEQYNRTLRALVDWPTQFWRSYYNIRELNVTVNENVKYRNFLHQILSKSATQGFSPANYVIKNLIKYYETIKEESNIDN